MVSLDLSPLFEGVRHAPLYGRDGAFAADALPTTARRAWVGNCLDMKLANPVVQTAWDQAVSDLASLQVLEGPSSEPFMITAGMPNYTGLFGRDAYLTALQTAVLNPMTLRGALEVVSRFNAETTDDEIDAEPGKVLHQRQLGPLAKLGLSPFLHYYGDASTPGLFLLAAAADLAHTGDAAFFLSLKPKLMGTLDWMRHNADEFGFYPYETQVETWGEEPELEGFRRGRIDGGWYGCRRSHRHGGHPGALLRRASRRSASPSRRWARMCSESSS